MPAASLIRLEAETFSRRGVRRFAAWSGVPGVRLTARLGASSAAPGPRARIRAGRSGASGGARLARAPAWFRE